jgi:hypothetical protein
VGSRYYDNPWLYSAVTLSLVAAKTSPLPRIWAYPSGQVELLRTIPRFRAITSCRIPVANPGRYGRIFSSRCRSLILAFAAGAGIRRLFLTPGRRVIPADGVSMNTEIVGEAAFPRTGASITTADKGSGSEQQDQLERSSGRAGRQKKVFGLIIPCPFYNQSDREQKKCSTDTIHCILLSSSSLQRSHLGRREERPEVKERKYISVSVTPIFRLI